MAGRCPSTRCCLKTRRTSALCCHPGTRSAPPTTLTWRCWRAPNCPTASPLCTTCAISGPSLACQAPATTPPAACTSLGGAPRRATRRCCRRARRPTSRMAGGCGRSGRGPTAPCRSAGPPRASAPTCRRLSCRRASSRRRRFGSTATRRRRRRRRRPTPTRTSSSSKCRPRRRSCGTPWPWPACRCRRPTRRRSVWPSAGHKCGRWRAQTCRSACRPPSRCRRLSASPTSPARSRTCGRMGARRKRLRPPLT
ncbi:hypothetical protein BU14_0066s0001 [Porphyra umbilicalis]|uniref:Uncharacterized protein n=1 Tax=Porphyra umbilicalis TaxID=2786 RepID=A0A1X6PGM7_PORUM|nr:hypothetical protein BU14_0066s0001 [Porphyra umbilicalis]|eukprot:OSX79948.1 hypothetical protein BU14_0066s0001 [Porphyra umbilicalis]